MKPRKVVRIGLDFDGVVTYNPLRIARLVVSCVKHKVLRMKKLGFFKPTNVWQRWIYYWGIVVPSLWPARGTERLKELAKSGKYEFYLVSGRYGFVTNLTLEWLKKHGLLGVFKKIYLNEENEQPHLFKLKTISALGFDYYVEDNLDIVRDLNSRGAKTKILWIYNVLDSYREYPAKYPYLEKALEAVVENENIN